MLLSEIYGLHREHLLKTIKEKWPRTFLRKLPREAIDIIVTYWKMTSFTDYLKWSIDSLEVFNQQLTAVWDNPKAFIEKHHDKFYDNY